MREAKCVVSRSGITAAVVLQAVCAVALWRAPAVATMQYNALQLSGNFETQELLRHSQPDKLQFVQNRNTFRLRVDWDWLKKGKLIDKYDLPYIENSKVFLLYRGVYDGFYDIAPTDLQHGETRFDDLVGGRITDLSHDTLTGMKFENRLREAYVDLKLHGAPLSFRLGRQQVIWGESDQFRMMDIWNPLDLTWHFQQESWDNLRIPLWLGKALWNIGELGPLNTSFLEVVYNPFDFQPGVKLGFLPQPWAAPFPDPLRSGQIQRIDAVNLTLAPVFNLQGSSLRHGNFQRNPQDASEVGTRFHAITPQGIEFSLNYLYGRGRGVGASSPFGVRLEQMQIAPQVIGQYQRDINTPASVVAVHPINVTAEVIHPYMHIFGLTGNYSEMDYTQAVFRFETAYAMGEPFQTTDPATLIPVTLRGQKVQTAPFGFTKRDVWAGMIGFDRPTWIRFLNPKATWFLTGQFFWNYTTGGHIDQLTGTSGAGDSPYFGPIGSWTTGQFKGQVERQQDAAAKGNGDNIRQWENLFTFAMTTFYRSGTVVPFLAAVWDPVNQGNEFTWNVDYFYTNDFIISLSQRFFMAYGSATNNDPWFVGRQSRRDETGLKLTYQF